MRIYIIPDGFPDGIPDGSTDGNIDGNTDGNTDGIIDGITDGKIDGIPDGITDWLHTNFTLLIKIPSVLPGKTAVLSIRKSIRFLNRLFIVS